MPSAYVPVVSLFPTRSARWVADSCRAGRIAGALKIGSAWFIREGAIEHVASGGAPSIPTVEDAAADLRARGIIR